MILDGPETVIYFPGQEPIELTCNITNGPIALWIVNGTSYSLPDLVQGELENHNASGINIVIKVPVNNTEYICSATTNQKEVESDPAFIFIAGKYVHSPLIIVSSTCMHVCTYVCSVCMYVCMYVCM